VLLREIKGLKYPDESVTRFFFKEKLFENPGRVLELGCGNGNNLSLFYQYGWDVTGVDLDEPSIGNAAANTGAIKASYQFHNPFRFICENMMQYVREFQGEPLDVLLMPSSLYYLAIDDIPKLLSDISAKGLTKPGTKMFFRMRDLDDYRFGKGTKVGHHSFVLDIDETNERGCTNTFFSRAEFLTLLQKVFRFKRHSMMKSLVENQQVGHLVFNSDFIFIGEIAGE
jgi:SAM-dependent methyltransferase